MYPLTPLKIYALDSVLSDSLCMVRMDRILRAIGRTRDEVVRVDEANVPEVASEIAGLRPPKEVPSGMIRSYMRPLVFTRIRVDEPLTPDITPILKRCSPEVSEHLVRTILGHIDASRPFHQYDDDWQKNMVCWPTFMLGTMTGCPHGCQYCGEGASGKMIAVGLNIEETIERLIVSTAKKNPQQRCFLLIGWGADEITFEPEYGAFDIFTTALDRLDRYVYFHTGGDNIDWIADLKHKDRLIGVWSATCDAVARVIEPGAGRTLVREVRRWDKDIPVYISTKSREMWDDLKDELGQNPEAYICGCSPVAVPGRKLALSAGLSHSTYLPEGS